MSDIQVDDTLLVAYADGEIDAATSQQIEALMATDPTVRARVAMFRRSADLLREAMTDSFFDAVPLQLTRSANRIVLASRLRRYARLSLPAAAAIAGFAIGTANLSGYLGFGGEAPASRVTHLLGEVADYHAVFARETEHLVEVPATRREHIEAWLGERVDYPFRVPDLSTRALTFRGARMLAVDGQPVAQLIYTDARGAAIALCIGRNSNAASTALQQVEERGLTLFGRASGNHIFVVAGPAGNPLLKTLALDMPSLFPRG